jgi:photosystem II stability/assembly factor-like uncharacterized protein
MRPVLSFLFSLFIGASVQAQWWGVQTSGLDTNLRSVSVAHDRGARDTPAWAVWASGSLGVILQSDNQGKTWARLHVEGGESLDFRGIVAFSASTAYVMSSGEGEKSRIYKTMDGGKNWRLQHTDSRKEFFLDAIACASETHCYALGDPIDGKFLLMKTTDGEHWNPLPSANMPAALSGEGAFAASNTCLLLSGRGIFFGTGGPAARVFHSSDMGRTWTVAETPVTHGNSSSGIFSIAHTEEKEIIVVGGDYKDPARASAVAAYSLDEGLTWQLSERQPGGFRSAVACDEDAVCVAIGPNGEDVSLSKVTAASWRPTDSLNLNALAIMDHKHGWAAGPKGTIARYNEHASIYRHSRSKPPGASSVAR